MKVAFLTAHTFLKDMYGISMSPDEFINIGMHAWELINMKDLRTYKLLHSISPEDISLGEINKSIDVMIDLPCNFVHVEAITLLMEEHKHGHPNRTYDYYKVEGDFTENYIEIGKWNTDPNYARGTFVKNFHITDRHIVINIDFNYFHNWNSNILTSTPLQIIYKGEYFDEDGLPFINDKQMEAIALYCAYNNNFKQGTITRDKFLIEVSQMLKNDWMNKVVQARVPQHISQNELDRILNVQTSWDRKRYNVSYKPTK